MTHKESRPGIILIAGPTASGKSALAMVLAERLGGAIVNADSMQVYRELRVLTARPSPADEARTPHKLYGVLSVAEACSAARWRDMAEEAIGAARAEGCVPILVGGTGLYFRALLEGLAPVPEIPPEVRSKVRELARLEGAESLHRRLAERDDVMASRLKPGDRQRVARALETVMATGRSLAEWQAMDAEGGLAGREHVTKVLLLPPREMAYARCDARLQAMVESGGLDEARALDAVGLDPDLPAMKALGVPHFLAAVRGEMALEDAITAAQTATRHYAKRQFTWFRHQFTDWDRFEAQQDESSIDKIVTFISKNTAAG
jgi:tRNA dimethylallyltransferase